MFLEDAREQDGGTGGHCLEGPIRRGGDQGVSGERGWGPRCDVSAC